MRQLLGLVLVFTLLLGTVAGTGVAQDGAQYVRGQPNLDVYAPESTVAPGTTAEITLQVGNDGRVFAGEITQREMVTTARSVTLEARDNRVPFAVRTRPQLLDPVTDDEVQEVPITVTVPADVAPGTYELPIRIQYTHTYVFNPDENDVVERSRTVTRAVTVTVDDGPRFELRTVDSDVQVGGSGTLVTEIENVGGETARELLVQLDSTSDNVALGNSRTDTARIDRLEPGESATIPYDATVRADATRRTYPLTGTVQFTDPDGVQDSQAGLSIGVVPTTEQEFSVAVNESTLRVGETGVVRGTIRNDGPANVTNVGLSLGDAQLEPQSRTYAVGDLAAGESATFRFRGVVPADADAVPQLIDVTTSYRTTAGTDRAVNETIYVPVARQRDAVAVTAVNATFAAGDRGTLRMTITNQRDVELRDARVGIAVEEPLESEFRTTVVPSLEPGESASVAFDLEVDGDAPSTRYPVVVETAYTDPDGNRATVRPATVAVEVTDADSDVPVTGIVVGGVVVVLIAAGGWWFYGRQFV